MAEWDALPKDILVLIAKRSKFSEDLCSFYAVCKSWHSITSILGKIQTLPYRFPWVMLTDKAEINYPERTKGMDASIMLIEQVRKNEQIEGMHNRQLFNFSASKAYEFELPEATRKKCLGVGYGLLLTIDYDLEINILNPFTRQQIGMPNMLSFKMQYEYDDELSPQEVIDFFVAKVAMSSNPCNQSNQEDCIVMAIYGEHALLAFARPGDKVWTDICHGNRGDYLDVVYYNGKFYAVNWHGNIDVCDINDSNKPKATTIAHSPDDWNHKYLVESSGDLLLVIRERKGSYYGNEKGMEQPYNHTIRFSIFKLEVCDGGNYPYKLTKVNHLGDNALFIGNNASVSVPSSKCVKANSIYFSDDDVIANSTQPYGGGYDTGIYDVESGDITLHYASNYMSHLTPPIWVVS